MSETPVISVVDQNKNQLRYGAEHQQSYRYPEREMASVEVFSNKDDRFELEADDAINLDVWTDKTVPEYEAPSYAREPLTRAQEVAMLYHRLDDKQLVDVARSHSHAVVSGLRSQYALGV